MREIVLDTETTGLDPEKGDRIVEIGCVELINHIPSGRIYHQYINPECTMSEDVVAVHGLTEEFLSDKPKFSEVVNEFLEFIGNDAQLVIHNAPFDMKFLNTELNKAGYERLSFDRVIDTLVMARKKFPGSRVNLNELCKRFKIDNSARTVHGALLDSELLAEVYLELLGGREPGLVFDKKKQEKEVVLSSSPVSQGVVHEKRIFPVDSTELERHMAFMKKIKNNLWEIG